MALQLSVPTRAAWTALEGRDFEAVEDLIADLTERHRYGEPIDVAGSVDVGFYMVDVVAADAIVAMLPGHRPTSLSWRSAAPDLAV
jgi:hypothetical protein